VTGLNEEGNVAIPERNAIVKQTQICTCSSSVSTDWLAEFFEKKLI